LGHNYFLWIESVTPGTYNFVKGQRGFTINRTAGSVDLSSKDDGSYGSSAPGLRSWSISGSVVPNLPDATGFTRLETLSNASPQVPFNIQLRKGAASGATPGDVVFAGSVYANLSSTGFDQDGPVVVSVEMSGVGAPTTDALAV
jgi:predicted secreted protein